jgi:hypothetical protein
LNNLFGWWQSIAVADLNGDGNNDLILGNIGENFYLHPDSTHPVKLWINDFNQNGTLDKILTYTVEGKDKPVFLKREIVDQFPGLKKQNLKHHDYATKTIQQLFKKELIKSSVVKKFNYCSSIVAINNGNGYLAAGEASFTIQKLPTQLQLSSVNAMQVIDINNDNRQDLVLGGNNFNFPPQFGRLDASYGDVLLNRGNLKFEWIAPARSGINLPGEVRDIKQIKSKNKSYILIVQNDQVPALYQINK